MSEERDCCERECLRDCRDRCYEECCCDNSCGGNNTLLILIVLYLLFCGCNNGKGGLFGGLF